jgi:hypothetical protein
VKIVALLCFFDELPTMLAATVASCGRLCDHVIAVDGAYELFPQGAGASDSTQHEAIVRAAEAVGIGITLHVPTEKWQGNEVSKRNAMFELGRLVAREEGDWFLIIDADEVIVDVPGDVREQLAETECVAATYGLVDHFDLGKAAPENQAGLRWVPSSVAHHVRGLYRNLPGLRVEGEHYRYTADIDGVPTDLWEGVPALDLRHLRIAHHRDRRPVDRNRRAKDYYAIRDLAGAERAPEHVAALA